MPRIVDDGHRNPCIVVEPDEVLEWLRSLADQAGYADRASCIVQISVQQEFAGGSKTHWEPPGLVLMISNIPNSRSAAPAHGS